MRRPKGLQYGLELPSTTTLADQLALFSRIEALGGKVNTPVAEAKVRKPRKPREPRAAKPAVKAKGKPGRRPVSMEMPAAPVNRSSRTPRTVDNDE
jgi:hypothetical protein